MTGGACGTFGEKSAYRVLVGRPEGKNHFQELDISGKIILKCF